MFGQLLQTYMQAQTDGRIEVLCDDITLAKLTERKEK